MDASDALKALQSCREDVESAEHKVEFARKAVEEALLAYSNSVEKVVRPLLIALVWERPRSSYKAGNLQAIIQGEGPLRTILENVLDDSWNCYAHFGDLVVYVRNELNRSGSRDLVVEMPAEVLKGLGIKATRKPAQEKSKILKLLKENGVDADSLAELLRKRKRT